MPEKICTFFMFNGQAEAAMNFYVSLFKNSAITSISRSGPNESVKEGTVMHATFTLNGQEYRAVDSGVAHRFKFSPAMSLYVDCESEEEINDLYVKLSNGGKVLMSLSNYGFSEKFAWILDKFGVSWQLNWH